MSKQDLKLNAKIIGYSTLVLAVAMVVMGFYCHRALADVNADYAKHGNVQPGDVYRLLSGERIMFLGMFPVLGVVLLFQGFFILHLLKKIKDDKAT
jgi:hypothetical protein